MPEKSRLKYWGWGYNDVLIPAARMEAVRQMMSSGLGIKPMESVEPLLDDQLQISKASFELNSSLSKFCSDEKIDRARHSYGRSFRDVVRALAGNFAHAPDYVAYPRTEEEIFSLYNFATAKNVKIIPFGGGSSVVGGVEPPSGRNFGVISLDMSNFDKVLEVDTVSKSARIQAGIFGPSLEKSLHPHKLSLRHFPQSFEFSTLGGWLATRSGGHFATGHTHIDDFVESIRMISPSGIFESRRLPASGAGPREEGLILGSEGTLGVITEAWMRLQPSPDHKKSATMFFSSYRRAVEATRTLAQTRLYPSNLRLIDKMEAFMSGSGDGAHHQLILGFESAHVKVDEQLRQAMEVCRKLGGTGGERSGGDISGDAADTWKTAFIQAPYLRDELIRMGLVVETFETAITWDKFEAFDKMVRTRIQEAIMDISGSGLVTCRFTHIYPDGVAPYYTIVAASKPGRQLEDWDAIKKIASDTILESGATITHHHAVGRDHMPWYRKQRSDIFHQMLKAAKQSVDPAWILNPGVLIDEAN